MNENMNVLDLTKPRFRMIDSYYRKYWGLRFNAAFLFKSVFKFIDQGRFIILITSLFMNKGEIFWKSAWQCLYSSVFRSINCILCSKTCFSDWKARAKNFLVPQQGVIISDTFFLCWQKRWMNVVLLLYKWICKSRSHSCKPLSWVLDFNVGTKNHC